MKPKLLIIFLTTCLVVASIISTPLILFLKQFLPQQIELIAYNSTDGFMLIIWVTIIIFLSLTSIFIGIYLYFYYKDALHKHEKDFIVKNVLPSSLLFIIGIIFGFYIYVVFMLGFFAETNTSLGLTNYWNFYSVLTSLIGFVFLMGIVFQFPLIIRGLIRFGLVEKQKLKDNRKLVVVGLLLLSAVITPSPDIFSQLFVAIPLYIMFEVSIL